MTGFEPQTIGGQIPKTLNATDTTLGRDIDMCCSEGRMVVLSLTLGSKCVVEEAQGLKEAFPSGCTGHCGENNSKERLSMSVSCHRSHYMLVCKARIAIRRDQHIPQCTSC